MICNWGLLPPVIVYMRVEALSTQVVDIVLVWLCCIKVSAVAVDVMVFVVALVPQLAVYSVLAVTAPLYNAAADSEDISPT